MDQFDVIRGGRRRCSAKTARTTPDLYTGWINLNYCWINVIFLELIPDFREFSQD